MLKEIHEQPSSIRDTLAGRVSDQGLLAMDELHIDTDALREVGKVFVVACGTAYHSGLVAKYAIEHWTRIPVEIDIASEFRYRDPVLGPDTLAGAPIPLGMFPASLDVTADGLYAFIVNFNLHGEMVPSSVPRRPTKCSVPEATNPPALEAWSTTNVSTYQQPTSVPDTT